MKTQPHISVIIPVFNSEETLDCTLSALFRSEGVDFEVVVVLDGPDDACRQIAMGYPTRLLELPHHSGGGAARNKGALNAKGEVLLFIDADVEVEPFTLRSILTIMTAANAPDAVIGAYSSSCPESGFFTQFKNLHHHYIHLTADPLTETFWTGCGAIRKDLFLSLGGFDTSRFIRNIGDIELGYRMSRNDYQVRIQPDIQVQHHKRYTFLSLVQSDLVERAIPWTRIMWHHRRFKSGLNARNNQALSTLLIPAAALIAVFVRTPGNSAGLGLACMLLFLFLNRHWLGYCFRHRGGVFTLQSIFAQVVYYLNCGLGAMIGTIFHFTGLIRCYLPTAGCRRQAPDSR